MPSGRATSPIPTISARPSPDERARFVELAASLGVSESALALTAKPSAYIAALVRAHVSCNPPLPTNEVALFKQGIVVLSRLGGADLSRSRFRECASRSTFTWTYVFNTYRMCIWRRSSTVKDATNLAKHGISLLEGDGVLSDPLGVTVADDFSEGERRWLTIGMNSQGELLVVVWTERDDCERLISVRRASAKERRDYEG